MVLTTNMNKIFQNICSFVQDLEDGFPKKQHTLTLYNRFLQQTKKENVTHVQKHCEIFRLFCLENQDAIIAGDTSKFKNNVIFFSKKINIKLDELFKLSDKETTETIFKHLLVILSLTCPESNATNVLKKVIETEKSNEGNFIKNMFDDIGGSMEEGSDNPIGVLGNMFASGKLMNMVNTMKNGMESGELDMQKLFGMMQGMIGGIAGNNVLSDMSQMLGKQESNLQSSPVENPKVSIEKMLEKIDENEDDEKSQ